MIDREVIRRAFELIAVTEELLDAWPVQSTWVQRQVFDPPVSMHGMPKVYRYHLRELMDRVVAGISLEPATKAEVMLILSDTSLTAMLNRNGDHLYCRLFQECFGSLPPNTAKPLPELHEGAADEMLVQMQKKYRKEGRKWVTT